MFGVSDGEISGSFWQRIVHQEDITYFRIVTLDSLHSARHVFDLLVSEEGSRSFGSHGS